METIYKIQTVNLRLKVNESPKKKAESSEAAVRILRGIYKNLDVDQEHFVMLALDQSSKVTGFKTLFTGGMSQCPIDFKVVFRTALLLGATRIIVAHNHPSGEAVPNAVDKHLTRQLNAAGDTIGIKVLDHIILGNGRYWSFADKKARDDLIEKGLRELRRMKHRR